MTATRQTHAAFHATGRRLGADLDPVAGVDLRPVLLARYHDLTALRYDFPLVLVQETTDIAPVRSLSGLMDDLIGALEQDQGAPRCARAVLKVERQIRSLAANGHRGTLAHLWDLATESLGTSADGRLRDSLARARATLKVAGDVVDCDRDLPRRLFEHAWRQQHSRKAGRFRSQATRLAEQLRELLRGDFSRSDAVRNPRHLKAAFGAAGEDIFDFGELSRILTTAAPATKMSDGRRQRIEALVSALESQRFYREGEAGDLFIFESCTAALRAYRERLPAVIELAKNLAIAQLEAAGTYDESRHDALFAQFGVGDWPLGSDDLKIFPDYLVCLDAARMSPTETTALMDALLDGLPMKVLFQTDLRSAPLAAMATGLATAYVFQAPSSHLYQLRTRIAAGFAFQGPTLFSVFSGVLPGLTNLPPYLVAAAALESRAFPAFTYNPAAGADWASRFDLSANPQPEADWPTHRFDYEDRRHQRVSVETAFTFADFAACDQRYSRHLAVVPRAAWNEHMMSIGQWLSAEPTRGSLAVPSLLMIDRQNRLQRVLADETIVRETRQCHERWHSLQELGGIHNSHAARLVARTPPPQATLQPLAQSAVKPPDGRAPVAAAAAGQPDAVEPDRSSGDPYIETPRCSTCNECVQINSRMFAYNENRQAYITDPDAGTYRQLVEAAESCQVSIIHPARPRNPNEPGLDELLARAQPFL